MKPTLGVAIPCHAGHFKYISALLQNIATSTDKPDEIVISCSSWKNNATSEFTFEGIPVKLFYTRHMLNASQNRNRAAGALKTDLISFLDADDLMHPRRIEFVRNTFDMRKDVDAVYHNYSYEPQSSRNQPFWDEPTLIVHPGKFVKDPNAVGIMVLTNPPNQLQHHHAHVTIRSSVFRRIQFPENPNFARMEDSVFGAILVANSVPMVYLENKLSRYMYGN